MLSLYSLCGKNAVLPIEQPFCTVLRKCCFEIDAAAYMRIKTAEPVLKALGLSVPVLFSQNRQIDIVCAAFM